MFVLWLPVLCLVLWIVRVVFVLTSAPSSPPRPNFRDKADELDWANYRGRWAPGMIQRERDSRPLRKPPDIRGVTFTDYVDYLDWANRRGRWSNC